VPALKLTPEPQSAEVVTFVPAPHKVWETQAILQAANCMNLWRAVGSLPGVTLKSGYPLPAAQAKPAASATAL